ncbi:helix-turn-helix domain-containing protein [Citrobacter koseri]|uniref:helix-turn-helix domain-containing protein n=1 Tax=Citrobacter koseri TaxID=545 RepID=UPI002941D99D|nr:helix-turn-helix domain-containing protein [Citrobacter koseri]WOJ16101.1 helix-turn-helix domain-containing protein [Citrobacter koseri]WOJ21882.1 helix-turn-helix domain-containing protein [Citrobacter koseri]
MKKPLFTQAKSNLLHSTPPCDGRLSIGERIQLARENLEFSEAELAGMLNLIPECISDWEEESCPVEATYIIPLANALKCDPMWLLDGHNGSTSTPLTPVNIMQGVDMSTIGKRINAARVSLGMSLDELECELNAPEGTVFRWETRKATPSSKYIDELAKILKTSVTWLLTGKEVEVSHE